MTTFFKDRKTPKLLVVSLALGLVGWVNTTAKVYAIEDLSSEYLPLELGVGAEMFFDARASGTSTDGMRQVFQGDVVVIGGGLLITADRVEIDRAKNIMECKGHVIILTEHQVFTGEEVTYQMATGDFRIIGATMVSSDSAESDRLSKEILGFSVDEIGFEEKRRRQLRQLNHQKELLQHEFRVSQPSERVVPGDVLDRYTVLLEREELIRDQENPVLAKMPEHRRELYKSRRRYWQRGRDADLLSGVGEREMYFRLQGRVIERTDGNDFRAQDAVFTTCLCDDDESPAWGFRSDRIRAQVGGYADFFHPVLEVKGVPVLYLPYLKLPIKSERQSGFLMPVFARDRRSGGIFSQPTYFALSERQDMTINTDYFQRRGVKLGLEYRFQQRQFSGWELKLEQMRDRLWLDDRALREEVFQAQHRDCSQILDPSELAACEAENAGLQSLLAVPPNTWRGMKSWRGLSIIAPRMSFVSAGQVYSDHRYVEELTLPDDFKDAFEVGHKATYFVPAKGRFHLDNPDFYAGVGASFGDNVRTDEQFRGYQLPGYFVGKSRLFALFPENAFGFVGYGQVGVKHRQILDFNADELEDQANRGLGSGHWQQAKFDWVSPVTSSRVVKVDHFADIEYRQICHDGLLEQTSALHSWRTGLTLNLPIDGEAKLPRLFRDPEHDDENDSDRFLHHLMNFALTFSVRPAVVRDGDYAAELTAPDTGEPIGPFYYYYSDQDRIRSNFDDAAADQDIMRAHRRVAFTMRHRWRSFARGWRLIPGMPRIDESRLEGLDDHALRLERARRELLATLEGSVGEDSDMFGEIEGDYVWYINRYQLQDYARSEFMSLTAGVAYDFLLAEDRRDFQGDPSQRPEPWSEPYMRTQATVAGFRLNNYSRYNLYTERFTEMDFGLVFPRYHQTLLTLGYAIKQDPTSEGGELIFTRTVERSARLRTTIIPHIHAELMLADRQTEAEASRVENYETRLRLGYLSPSRCWRFDFIRTKAFGKDESDANYLMQLTVLFLGQQRPILDGAPALMRELPGDRNS